MSLTETIKIKILESIKSGNHATRNILKVALGEIQTLESRNGSITEEEAVKAVRKIIDGNKYSIEILMQSPAISDIESSKQINILRQENQILGGLLPAQITKEELLGFFQSSPISVINDIIAAPNDGKAIGLAMKFIKENKISVDGKRVAEIVKEIRTTK